MKRTAVVFASSKEYSIGVCINIMALEKKSPNLADKYVVYCDSWDKETMDKLKSFTDKVEFIEFTQQMFEEKFLSQRDTATQEAFRKFINRYSHFSAIHSELFLLLKDYNQIIYMEPDFVILGDVSELKELDTVAWRGGAAVYSYKGKKLNHPNGGLLIFPDTIPYEELSNKYIDYFSIAKLSETALGSMMHDYNIDVINLPCDYNYVEPFIDVLIVQDSIKIFHTVGGAKIWNSDFWRCVFPEYVEYLDYFGYKYTNDKDVIISRDDFIQNLLKMRTIVSMPHIEIYHPDVHPDLHDGRFVYRYKNYKTIFFSGRKIQQDVCRIYFNVINDLQLGLMDFIMKSKEALSILNISEEKNPAPDIRTPKYRFMDYGGGVKVFYCDCNKKNLIHRFNEMIMDFTRVVDLFFGQDNETASGKSADDLLRQNAELLEKLKQLEMKIDEMKQSK